MRKSILNIPKAWAAMNRKNVLAVDNKGYLQTYICKVEVVSTNVLSYLYTAPENWVTKNAVRKWHAFREMKRAQGMATDYAATYGKNIRPLLHSGHQTSNNAADFYELQSIRQAGVMAGGDWDYTRVAQTPGAISETGTQTVSQEETTDLYHLCLSGGHVEETGHTTSDYVKYSHVSMVQSYLESRRNMSVDDTDDSGSLTDTPNPLQEFIYDSSASKLHSGLLKAEQRQKPPYETGDSSDTMPADPLDRAYAGAVVTTSTYGRDSAIVRIPGGLLEAWSVGVGATPLPIWNIEVLGVTRCEG